MQLKFVFQIAIEKQVASQSQIQSLKILERGDPENSRILSKKRKLAQNGIHVCNLNVFWDRGYVLALREKITEIFASFFILFLQTFATSFAFDSNILTTTYSAVEVQLSAFCSAFPRSR